MLWTTGQLLQSSSNSRPNPSSQEIKNCKYDFQDEVVSGSTFTCIYSWMEGVLVLAAPLRSANRALRSWFDQLSKQGLRKSQIQRSERSTNPFSLTLQISAWNPVLTRIVVYFTISTIWNLLQRSREPCPIRSSWVVLYWWKGGKSNTSTAAFPFDVESWKYSWPSFPMN